MHISQGAHHTLNATAQQPAEGKSAAVDAVVVLGYSVFAFSKEAALEGPNESPRSLGMAHSLFSCSNWSPLEHFLTL